jgi:hypothetical protein
LGFLKESLNKSCLKEIPDTLIHVKFENDVRNALNGHEVNFSFGKDNSSRLNIKAFNGSMPEYIYDFKMYGKVTFLYICQATVTSPSLQEEGVVNIYVRFLLTFSLNAISGMYLRKESMRDMLFLMIIR